MSAGRVENGDDDDEKDTGVKAKGGERREEKRRGCSKAEVTVLDFLLSLYLIFVVRAYALLEYAHLPSKKDGVSCAAQRQRNLLNLGRSWKWLKLNEGGHTKRRSTRLG